MSSWFLLSSGCMFLLPVHLRPTWYGCQFQAASLLLVLPLTGLCNDAYVCCVAAHLLGEGVR